MRDGGSHTGAPPADDDAAWRECASYEERFTRPAVLEFQPSNIRLELEQSGGDGSGFDFDQVTVWPAGVIMARALQHPAMAIAIAGRRVLELGSGCGVAGLVAAAMGAEHVSLTDLPAVLPVLTRNAQRSCGSGSGGSGSGGSGSGGSGGSGSGGSGSGGSGSSGCGGGGGSGDCGGCGDGGGADAKWEVWALEWDDEDRAAQVARAGPLDVILGADVAQYGDRRRPGRSLSESTARRGLRCGLSGRRPPLCLRGCSVPPGRVISGPPRPGSPQARFVPRLTDASREGKYLTCPYRSRRLCSCCRIWRAPCTR